MVKIFAAGSLVLFVLLVGVRPLAAQTETVPETDRAQDALSATFRGLVETVRPSVVQIFISRYSPNLGSSAGGVDLYSRQRGSGSGVIVDPEGFILTNAHVVEGAERIKVLISAAPEVLEETRSIVKPRGTTLEARLIGMDSETDLAVLKVDAGPLPSLEFSDSDDLYPGQLVFAFGSPLGLETSVTMGVVSGTGRQLEPDHPMVYIQTDASINPGNSGGPLVIPEGTVVGINTLIFSQSGGNEGVGFAAPSNIAAAVYRQIRAHGRVLRGEIGALVQTITPAMASAWGMPVSTGVVVGDVTPGSPAETAGLKVGDVVLSLDDKPMENGRQFNVNLYQRSPGETVTVRVLRNQSNQTLRIPVVERSDDPNRFAGMVTIERNLIPRLGVLALEIDGSLQRMLPPLRKEGGVLVAVRASGGAPWQESLEPGDVIFGVNRREITNLSVLKMVLAELPQGSPVVFQIERNRTLRYLVLDLD